MKYEKGNIKEEHMVINEIYGLRKASVTVDLLNEMGWKEIIDEPEVLFKRIISMVTDFRYEVKKEEREKDWFLNKISIQGQNRKDRDYGKTFDRLLFSDGRNSFTVICNMHGSGARYLVFQTGNATPIHKCSNRKELASVLRSEFDS